MAAAIAAFTLAACQKQELTFEERFHSANLAAAPGEKLADCMVSKLRSSAAFRIGQQAARENARVEGLIIQPADRNQVRLNGLDVQMLLDDAGEALAVACGVDRADWRARSPYLLVDGGENKINEVGIRSMSYGIAMVGFQKRMVALPGFLQGAESVQHEQAATAHQQESVQQSREQKEAERMRDFAVTPEPAAPEAARRPATP